jgi:hypothetical protein
VGGEGEFVNILTQPSYIHTGISVVTVYLLMQHVRLVFETCFDCNYSFVTAYIVGTGATNLLREKRIRGIFMEFGQLKGMINTPECSALKVGLYARVCVCCVCVAVLSVPCLCLSVLCGMFKVCVIQHVNEWNICVDA